MVSWSCSSLLPMPQINSTVFACSGPKLETQPPYRATCSWPATTRKPYACAWQWKTPPRPALNCDSERSVCAGVGVVQFLMSPNFSSGLILLLRDETPTSHGGVVVCQRDSNG